VPQRQDFRILGHRTAQHGSGHLGQIPDECGDDGQQYRKIIPDAVRALELAGELQFRPRIVFSSGTRPDAAARHIMVPPAPCPREDGEGKIQIRACDRRSRRLPGRSGRRNAQPDDHR
jgi:hypothetical protein